MRVVKQEIVDYLVIVNRVTRITPCPTLVFLPSGTDHPDHHPSFLSVHRRSEGGCHARLTYRVR